jgi:radical SAM protein with 4Fe4S-binding SPASM domain
MTPYNYNSSDLIKRIDLTDREEFLLKESKTFCMYPWVHLHAYPNGDAYPCCSADMKVGKVGSCRTETLEEIWNGEAMNSLRTKMLSEQPTEVCNKCYEKEKIGFMSERQSANKHHGHHIKKIERNAPFELTYWDIRFSNLCNLRCRSCGHIFSSQWHSDQKNVVLKSYWNNVRGPDWPINPPKNIDEYNALPENIKTELTEDFGGEILSHLEYVKKLPALTYAGKTEIDMWNQLEPHLDFVEQIYFAGGEPLLMEEHYRILDELDRRGMHHVRLIYNTNFTHTDLKGRSVFDYWKKFQNVSVGASLDASGARAEYVRKGTVWADVEHNRKEMLRICPGVDFYISPTLSIMNALHLPEFHREWTEKGLIRAQDLNVNILQDPVHYRIDIAPSEYKQQLTKVYQDHIQWLESTGDSLGRASQGFKSAIKFLNATDNTHLIKTFWKKTQELDEIRRENCLDVIPELKALK